MKAGEVNIDFLFHDHKTLKKAEHDIHNQLKELVNKSSCCNGGVGTAMLSSEIISSVMEKVLEFDDQLMTHLGEEEEIVVPMSLTEKEIWF